MMQVVDFIAAQTAGNTSQACKIVEAIERVILRVSDFADINMTIANNFPISGTPSFHIVILAYTNTCSCSLDPP
jgi:hypothetical protein